MSAKITERDLAILLRKQGLSYREILSEITVAKSTLSLWLRKVGLSKMQAQRLTNKKRAALIKGATRKREIRIARTKKIQTDASKEIGVITERDLLMLGIALYWAEGSKQKEHLVSQRIAFANSDPKMINLFIYWLRQSLRVEKERISLSLYIHSNHKHRLDIVKQYWSDETGYPVESFAKVYFKRHNRRTLRKNTGDTYYGLVRVDVRSSTDLNRKVAGWIQGLQKHWGVV